MVLVSFEEDLLMDQLWETGTKDYAKALFGFLGENCYYLLRKRAEWRGIWETWVLV